LPDFGVPFLGRSHRFVGGGLAFVAVVYHAPSFGVVGADDFAAGQDVGRAVPARVGGYGIVCVFAFGLQVVGQPLGNLPPASSRLIWLPLKRVWPSALVRLSGSPSTASS